MNFFKIKTSWSNIELGLIKATVASAYIMIGVYFHKYLEEYLMIFGLIFILTTSFTFYLWVKKMKAVSGK